MLKKLIFAVIGKDNYLKYVLFIIHVHRSFLPFKHRGNRIMKKYLIPRGGVVLDIGANIGRFTGLAASLVGKSGRVHSFEPVYFAFRVLRKMVSLKMLRHVIVNQKALSDKSGSTEISIPLRGGWRPRLPMAHLGGTSQNAMKQTITMQRLDDYCAEKDINQIDFIKCDTEGYEYFIFAGGLESLARYKPSIMCEIYEKYSNRQNLDPSSVFVLLRNLGYNSYIPTKQGTLVPVKGYERPTDYVFIHPSKMNERLLEIIETADK